MIFKINIKLLILFFLFSPKAFSQESLIHQPDSIYKENKIKLIKYYLRKKLFITVLCDKEGRWIEYDSGIYKKYIQYDESGKMTKITEVFRDKDYKTKTFEIEIEYSKDELKKLTKYNPDGTLNEVEHFENMGKKKIRELYKNALINYHSITEYFDDFNEKNIYRWFINKNSKKIESFTTYKYKLKNGQIKKYIEYRQGIRKQTANLRYNENNLLKEVIFSNTIGYYKYERY